MKASLRNHDDMSTRTTRVLAVLLVATAAQVVGCGGALHGQWKLVRAIPNKDAFAMEHASFNKDGTFSATITHEGRTNEETGRYEFKALKLHLMPTGGGRRTYNVIIRLRRLEIKQGKHMVILEKV
jgi:hypothetical protein